jgi:hypothetical protein
LRDLRFIGAAAARHSSFHAGRRVLGDRKASSGAHEQCDASGVSEFGGRLGVFREKEGFDARHVRSVLGHDGGEPVLDRDETASEVTFLFDIEHAMGHVAQPRADTPYDAPPKVARARIEPEDDGHESR